MLFSNDVHMRVKSFCIGGGVLGGLTGIHLGRKGVGDSRLRFARLDSCREHTGFLGRTGLSRAGDEAIVRSRRAC